MEMDREEIRRLADRFEGAPPEEVLQWAWENLGTKVGMSTAFGASGVVLIDMAQKQVPDLPIFTIDTGYLFSETLELKQRIEARYGVEIETIHPRLSVADQDRVCGTALYKSDPDRCCQMRKVEPLQRKLADLHGWVTGLRRDQSETRRSVRAVEGYWFDNGRMIAKLNPLAGWTRKQVWDYILEYDVPYNPLMDQGYPSIGCQPCTQSAGSNGDERSGRWAGAGKTECGIHTAFVAIEAAEPQERLAVNAD